MAEVIAQTTRTTPDYGVESSPAPAATISRPIPEGFRAWLPALVVLLGMPLLALATTKFVLFPSVRRALAISATLPGQSAPGQGATTVYLERIRFTASSATGAHSGIRSLALVGDDSSFKSKVNQNKAALMHLAALDLKGTTVFDLDQPGALDNIRAQLLADFNRVLGGSSVKEIYITEWPLR